MPHRSDKRDYIALMALVSGLDIEFADGVNGSEMHPKAFPSVSNPENLQQTCPDNLAVLERKRSPRRLWCLARTSECLSTVGAYLILLFPI